MRKTKVAQDVEHILLRVLTGTRKRFDARHEQYPVKVLAKCMYIERYRRDSNIFDTMDAIRKVT